MSGSAQNAVAQAIAQNQSAREMIWRAGKPIFQKVATKTFTNVASGNDTMVINPLQVGFLRRFVVEIVATVHNADGAQSMTLTPNGADNLLSSVTFTDFTGNPRHSCSGRSLSFVEAAKYRRIPGAALTSDSVSGFGSIVASDVATSPVAFGADGTVTRVFDIPIMVDNGRNMAGGMWLGVNNQSSLLTLKLNDAPVALPAGDPLLAVYQLAGGGTVGGTITSATVNVFQEYWNNVPVDGKTGNPILPGLDLQTAYMITETDSGMTFAANQIASWNFPTFSKMLGTYLSYDNGLALNAGTDWSRLALVVSNYAIVREYTPNVLDRVTRDAIGASFPKGSYAIMSRSHPLDVTQYPSLQLQFTPSVANSGAAMKITTELLRQVQFMGAASGVGGA